MYCDLCLTYGKTACVVECRDAYSRKKILVRARLQFYPLGVIAVLTQLAQHFRSASKCETTSTFSKRGTALLFRHARTGYDTIFPPHILSDALRPAKLRHHHTPWCPRANLT